MKLGTLFVLLLPTLLWLCAQVAGQSAFVPCSNAAGTSLEGLLVGVTMTRLNDEAYCSWRLRYQFVQPNADLALISKLSALVTDLRTSDIDVLEENGCWAGCVQQPTYGSETFNDFADPWRFGVAADSCACMRGNYTFEIAMTGVGLQMGEIGVESKAGESFLCPAITFTDCPGPLEETDMTEICPLDHPLGDIDPNLDDCTVIGSGKASEGLNGGEIAGIVIGSIAGAIIIGGVATGALGALAYGVWKGIHQPSKMAFMDATEAANFQINTHGVENPVYVSPVVVTDNPLQLAV